MTETKTPINCIILNFGYVEGAYISSVTYTSIAIDEFYSPKEAFISLAEDLHAKWLSESTPIVTRECCKEAFEVHHYCPKCGRRLIIRNTENDFLGFCLGLIGQTADSYGESEFFGDHNANWWPFSGEDGIFYIKNGQYLYVYEIAEILLSSALKIKNPKIFGEDDYTVYNHHIHVNMTNEEWFDKELAKLLKSEK